MRLLRGLLAFVALLALLVGVPAVRALGGAGADGVVPGHVLVYGPSLAVDAPVNEATVARSLGYEVAIADSIAWRALRRQHFAQYDAVVVGDRGCDVRRDYLGLAAQTRQRWTPAVTGNVAVLGTDPVYHANLGEDPGARALIENGLRFATAGRTTGAYIALGCAYYTASNFTPVPLLAGFGPFTVRGQGRPPLDACPNAVRIASPRSPLVAGLTAADLSNWDCTVHAGIDSFPYHFKVVATHRPSGMPFLLTRGPWTGGASERRTVVDVTTAPDASRQRSMPSSPNAG